MPDAFDPYHKWLGIPPEHQPPDHYRLLGIKPLENDPDVIESASDQRMMLLRSYQTGRHSELSQRLLNEVAAAKVCLLKPDKKAPYDRRLRQKLQAEAEAKIQTLPKAELVESAQQTAAPGEAIPSIAVSTGSHTPSRKRVPWQVPVLAVSLVVAGVLVYALWANRPPTPPSTALVFDWPETERKDASLEIDGRSVPVPPTGPVQVACKPGKYHIIAGRPGYKAVEQTVTVKAGEERIVKLVWQEVPPSPEKGVLVLIWPESQRVDAKLVIDGESAAVPPTGPCEYRLPPGEHRVVAGRPGFKPIEQTVIVEAGEEKTLPLKDWQELPPSPPGEGVLVLNWPESQRADATVLIDGESAAVPKRGRCEYPLQSGEHRVVVRRPGLEPFEQTVMVAAGQQTIVNVVLYKPERRGPLVVEKLPVPSEPDQREAEKRLREIFKEEYKKATTAKGKLRLAELLLEQAGKTSDDSTGRYVMLTQAVDLALELGEVIIARDALIILIDKCQYNVDAWALRVEALSQLRRKVSLPVARASVAHAALDLVEPALDEDRYEVADQLANIGVAAASQLRDVELRKWAQQLLKRVRDTRKLWKQYQPDFETLKTQPDDPDANLGAGKYFCFVKGDWPRGLPHLAKGSDAALKALAEADLARPPEALKQVELGDRWKKLAEGQPDLTKREIQSRAAYWYKRALPRLSGLEKVAVERSVEGISKALAAGEQPASGVTGQPRPGQDLPVGTWGDLAKWVETDRDCIHGQWTLNEDTITVTPRQFSRMALPVSVEGSYDLQVSFVRLTGVGAIVVSLPVGSRECHVTLSGYDGQASGIRLIDGKDERRNPTRRPGTLINGRQYHLLITVRLNGELATIKVFVNSTPFTGWTGPQSSLNFDARWTIRDRTRPGLGAHDTVTFANPQIRLISGKAALIPSTREPTP